MVEVIATAVLTALTAGGGLGVWFKFQLDKMEREHNQRREDRKDEVDVLREVVAGMKVEWLAMKRELSDTRAELSDCKEKHQVSLLEEERQRGEICYLQREIARLLELCEDDA